MVALVLAFVFVVRPFYGLSTGDYKIYIKTYSIKKFEIPEGAVEIGNYAFYGCTSLTGITIPDSVTSIDSSAFYGCSSLKTVYYGGTATDWAKIGIDSSNSKLTDATRYYYSETQPTTTGRYWHYVDGVPTKW